MYCVEALTADCPPSITYLPSESIEFEWSVIVVIPQMETDQAELQEARTVASKARACYTSVRIIRPTPGGLREVVA